MEDLKYLSHMGACVEPPPKHRTRWKPRETTTKRPSPFVPFLVLFGSPAMNWDHAVSLGRRVWVSVSDTGRVGHTGSGRWPTEIEKNRKRVSCYLAWVVVRQKHTCVTNRSARGCGAPPGLVGGVFPSEWPPAPAHHLLHLQKGPVKHRSSVASDGRARRSLAQRPLTRWCRPR